MLKPFLSINQVKVLNLCVELLIFNKISWDRGSGGCETIRERTSLRLNCEFPIAGDGLGPRESCHIFLKFAPKNKEVILKAVSIILGLNL